MGVPAMQRRVSSRLSALAAVVLLGPLVVTAAVSTAVAAPARDDTPVLLHPKGEIADEFNGLDEIGNFAKLRDAYFESRLVAGDKPISVVKAAQLRRKGIKAAQRIGTVSTRAAAATVGGAWSSIGPSPIVQVGRTSNTFEAVSGRVGALAVRRDGTIILGAAQGGVWTYDPSTGTWTPRTQDTDTQSVGALAVAPSNDKVVYLGSGEGALSGDSYYGDGVYKSTDGGLSWRHVSGTFFQGISTSDIVVDPTNANHLYLSTLRGRGGIRRTTPPASVAYGIWESRNGGVSWRLRKGTTDEFSGATDLVMDPRNPKLLLASFWGDGIYRSTNGGASWKKAMGNLPKGQFLAGATRFSIGLSHPAGDKSATVYTGFDYTDNNNVYHPSRLWRSTNAGNSWHGLPTGGPASDPDSILDYCTTQCFYDNVISPDPKNADVVYVAGSFGYDQSPGSGGVYRTKNGGDTWRSLGYDLHPDYHAFAFDPSDSKHVVVGNDGGVWQSHNGGGRPAGTPLSAADWENLNGQVDPATAALVHDTGLRITQFTSIATVPTVAGRYWGGTQDNGTLRKSTANDRWFDQSSGDGGQVLVDPTNEGYVFGTFFGISPWRFTPATAGFFFGNEPIDGGIDTTDRAEFYVPWVMNKSNPNQLFLGTYRLYRTDNAEAATGGDVHWDAISPDLTTGCTGTAPNGARGCLISAVGVADGGDAVYTGSDDGKVFVSPDAVTADAPTWRDVTASNLPNRPVTQIAVDRSNSRIAYLSYAGFSAATPTNAGHLFKTTNGGDSWTDVSGDLPDLPVNSVVLDPSFPDTLYAGTDIGPYVTTDGGGSWSRLGTAMPKVAAWQLDFDPTRRLLVDGTHGRGAYSIADGSTAPALVVSKADTGVPVGPGSDIHYTITVRNVGNADATGVSVTDPLPAHTSFVSADNGGTAAGGAVSWAGLSVPAGGSIQLQFTVAIDGTLDPSVSQIVDDGLTVSADGGFGTTGSPHVTLIAPPHAVTTDPSEQSGGAKVATHVDYTVHVTNEGFLTDNYALSVAGDFASSTLDATCTTPTSTKPDVAAGDSTDVCVRVEVPAGASNDQVSDSTLTVTSNGDSTVTATAVLHTYAVTTATLLVDNDNNAPDVASIYKDALTGAGEAFGSWDLGADAVLPATYLNAHTNVVWFTGASFPAPLSGYEPELSAFLSGGGRLLMSGQDILDQSAGTTAFVHDFLHVDWDGSEIQNDKPTSNVTGVTGNPVTDGIGAVPLDLAVLDGVQFSDQITPIAPATPAFTDDSPATDGLTVADGPYKVVFLAFPLEEFGTAAQKSDLLQRSLAWFGS
jgi:uncharacterized repeat protein (TIGR01451 family)